MMETTVINGDDLPPGLHDALLKGLHGNEPNIRPARLQDVRGLLEGANQPAFEIGDIVQLRPYAAGDFRWPKADDRCIITQVLDQPHREGENGTFQSAQRNDIALAFIQDGAVIEYLHDSRRFQKVGSIYDPIVTSDGETLAVE